MSSGSELSNTTSPKQQATLRSQRASLARIVKAQVTLLISNLNEGNFTRIATEIQSLIDTHGEDIRIHLFRYLLSDICKQNFSTSPHFRLLQKNAVFTSPTQEKLEAIVSFSSALGLFYSSKNAFLLDLDKLLNNHNFDAIDKVVVAIPLFSGATPEVNEKAKIIFNSNIQNATTTLESIKSVPDNVLLYLLHSITRCMNEKPFNFEYSKLQNFIQKLAEFCTDKAMVDDFQHCITSLAEVLNCDQQLKEKIIEMYINNPSSVTRILELIKKQKLFPDILDTLPLPLNLDLVYLADQSKQLNLETWLTKRLNNSQHKEAFISQCLDYVNQKVYIEAQRSIAPQMDLPISLSPDALNTFLKFLSESSPSPQILEALKSIENRRLQSKSQPTANDTSISFKPDIEEEANQCYEQLYKGELSLDTMIQILKTKSVSNNPRDKDFYACMIHILFDEYAFFPKYPDKELFITSVLFGSLVQYRLVSNTSLNIALRYVLEALHNPNGSKMFNFGVQALRQFQSRLSEWPQYCSQLMQIPGLIQTHPEIAAQVQSVLRAQENPPHEGLRQPDNYYFKSVCVPKFPVSKDVIYSEPSTAIQDKVLFIVNNVAQNNIQEKVVELLSVLQPSSYKWFSNYLVVKRISTEPNYHELYISMLDSVNSRLLNAHILFETYANLIILLNSEKTLSDSSERTLLKNLGSWLGQLTLAKNKPILQKHIALKELLLEGYDTHRLIVTIPFVCKILEQGAKSKVFKPPNPWLMAIVRFLVELYENADLKLTLKFEIEVLCKSLGLELKDIRATLILKNRQPQINPAPNTFAVAPFPTQSKEALESGAPFSREAPVNIPGFGPYVVFNPQISLYATRPGAKRLVLQAFTESIREIIGPVVERAVAIAVVSTRDLILKDFMMEPDESKMRSAAHLMAQNLAASLAVVTSKEPLRLSVVFNLKTIFLAHGLNDNAAEQAIILTVADNLDLLCAVIEKSAMEKAIIEIDEVMASAYLCRTKHHEQRTTQPYVDMGVYQMSGFINALPPALRPRPNGLQAAQLSVYEAFMRIPRVAPVGGNMAGGDPIYGAYNSTVLEDKMNERFDQNLY